MVTFVHFARSFLTGFSQILLQSNCLTGLLVLVGIGLNSLPMLLSAIGGSLIACLGAMLLGADRAHLRQGLYGYNGALIGLACALFWPSGVDALVLLPPAALLSALMMKLAIERLGCPAYTAPFILGVWICLACVAAQPVPVEPVVNNLLNMFLLGFGQVLFQDNPLSGLLFLIGLAVSSRRALAWGLLAILFSAGFAFILGFGSDLILSGVYSYNAVLIALALSASARVSEWIIIAAILGSVVVTALLQKTGGAVLTAPFVTVTWLVLLLLRRSNADSTIRFGELGPE